MLLYIYLFIFLVVAFLVSSFKKKFTPFFTIISFIILCFFSAFRGYSVGTDTSHYQMLFDYFDDLSIQDVRGEYFFSFLFYLVKLFGGSYRVFLILTSFLFYLPLYIAIRRSSINPMLSVFLLYSLGFCFMFFNISRQLIAVSLSLFAFIACSKNNLKWFLIIVFLCTIIHTSSVFVLLFWFINKLKIASDKYIAILFITFIIPFIFNFSYLIESILSYLPVVSKYVMYLDDEPSKSVFSLNRLLLNVLFIYILSNTHINKLSFWLCASIWGIILLNLFPTNSIVSRVYYYFSVTQIFFFPEFFKRNQQNKLIVMSYSFVIFVFYIFSNIGQFIPYVLSFGDN